MQPNFSNCTTADHEKFSRFFLKTQPENIQNNTRNLNELSRLFDHNFALLKHINPHLDQLESMTASQWELDRLSEMKVRLAQAIEQKKSYYQNHWFGKITQCFLKIFGLWDNSNTPAIKNAEKRLFATDTRNKLIKDGKEYQICIFFYPAVFTEDVRNKLNTTHFYNYNPNRRIKLKGDQYWNNGTIENASVE